MLYDIIFNIRRRLGIELSKEEELVCLIVTEIAAHPENWRYSRAGIYSYFHEITCSDNKIPDLKQREGNPWNCVIGSIPISWTAFRKIKKVVKLARNMISSRQETERLDYILNNLKDKRLKRINGNTSITSSS